MTIQRILPSTFAVCALALSACTSTLAPPLSSDNTSSGTREDTQPLTVFTSFYPIHFLTTKIGGDLIHVESLTPPGADAHHLELSPAKIAQIGQADAVIFAAGFQNAIDEALEANPPHNIVDIAPMVQLLPITDDDVHDHDSDHDHGHDHADKDSHDDKHDHAQEHDHDHGGLDPHFWLDPKRMANAATVIGQALAKADPANAQTYTKNAASTAKEMEDLAAELVGATASCKHTTFVTAHTAFSYLAERAGLTQVGMSNIDPEAAPSPARLAEIAALVKAKGITTIFSEELIDPKVAQTLASDLGIQTASLDTLENQTDPSMDYTAVMKKNIATLHTALECQ